jgi:hypothetical protein
MNKDEVRKQCEEFLSMNYPSLLKQQAVTPNGIKRGVYESDIDTLEAFARALVVKTLQEVGQDFVSRMRKAKESGPCTVQAVKGVTVDHVGWIDAEIQRIKEGA